VPICERYPEFMEEQWDLDEREEEEAKVEAALNSECEKVEAAKKAQKDRRKQQNKPKKRAKEEELRRATTHTASPLREISTAPDESTVVDDDRFGPSVSSLLAPPFLNQAHSPAPTAASSVDYQIPETESGYNSEVLEGEWALGEGEGEHEGYMEVEDDRGSHLTPVMDLNLNELL